MTEKYYPSMEKSCNCKPGQLCDYHITKINFENIIDYIGISKDETHRGSANPPLRVWGKEQINKIRNEVSGVKNEKEYKNFSIINKITTVLDKTNSFWEEKENSDALNGELHEEWVKWIEEVKEKNKYGAGGWKASPQQLSQFIEVLKVLHEENIQIEDYLRIGTASGKHTQQEIFAMSVAMPKDGKKPELSIIDLCEPPLVESKVLAKNAIKETFLESILELPKEMYEKYSVVSSHFTESFLPTKKIFEDSNMKHEDAVNIKENFFKNIFKALKDNGFFISALAIENSPRRFNNLDELKKCLKKVGFKEENIVIVPTTDPYDYDEKNKVLIEGNYFIVAQKI
ncbi:MAG: hypothetical protein HQK78_16590 [Desulfobacterales bacterium]|nr:hypothetical protein [Desulfobacterales bacterium]